VIGICREPGVDGEALAERLAARRGRGRERLDRGPRSFGVHVIRGERRDAAPVADPRVEQPQLQGQVGQVGRGLHAHVGSHHDPRGRDGGEELLVRGLRGVGHRGSRLRPEVLDDHLLDVTVPAVQVADREHRPGAFARVLADPHEDARGERDRQAAGVLDRPQTNGRTLVRRAEVRPTLLRESIRRRLEHQAHRRAHLSQPGELLVAHDAGVQVRQETGLLDHADGGRAHVLERRGVPAGAEPAARDLVPILRPVAQGEEGLLARPLPASSRDREHVLRRQVRSVEPRRRLRERAVVAMVATEHGERDEDLA
jgi:hypothetical protein